jgi:8-oxo-dGTP pyrophosphatase MutT (NUDIX family)
MEVDRPAPGEELNLSGVPTAPRQAATVIVVRGGEETLEVLLVRRNPSQRFMGGAWVFPGGAVDAEEAAAKGDLAHRLAAIREAEEEAGIALGAPESLHPFSRWITPAQIAIRFDTRFFIAPMPAGAEPRVDGGECVDWGWWGPRAALRAYEAGEMMLVFPTIKTLEQLEGFGSAEELLTWADGREVVPIEPRVVVEGEVARVLLPGDPGYEG